MNLEVKFSSEPSDKISQADTWVLGSCHPEQEPNHAMLDLQSTELCRFKVLSLWQFVTLQEKTNTGLWKRKEPEGPLSFRLGEDRWVEA